MPAILWLLYLLTYVERGDITGEREESVGYSCHGPAIFGLSVFSVFLEICPGFGSGFRSQITIQTLTAMILDL